MYNMRGRTWKKVPSSRWYAVERTTRDAFAPGIGTDKEGSRAIPARWNSREPVFGEEVQEMNKSQRRSAQRMLAAIDHNRPIPNLRIRKKIGSVDTFLSGMIDGQANRAWVAMIIREEMSK